MVDQPLKVKNPSLKDYTGFKFKREVRDPLYNYIYFTEIESNIIDTNEFQRLDRLLQTPSAHFVYPNATHTRKAHSLGVMHLAHNSLCELVTRQSPSLHNEIPKFLSKTCVYSFKPLDKLELVLGEDWWDKKSYEEIIQTFRIAGLLHDIGHGPFSHIFEDACSDAHRQGKCDEFKHEDMSVKIINDRLEKNFDQISKEDVINILTNKTKNTKFLSEILDGPYDIDKIDYLGRDSYHAGAFEYGTIDYERIISGIRVLNGKLLISSSSLNAVMNTFTAAQNMYTNVYYHKTSRIIDFMILESLSKVPHLLQKIIEDMDLFIETDDQNFICFLKSHRNGDKECGEAYELMKDVINRKLKYHTLYKKMVTLSAARNLDANFTELQNELETNYSDLKTKVDFSTKVKPLRVDPIKLLDWLIKPVIFNEDTGKAESLWDINRAYYLYLTKSQVLFTVLIDRDMYKRDPESDRIKELKKEISEGINMIEKEEDKLKDAYG